MRARKRSRAPRHPLDAQLVHAEVEEPCGVFRLHSVEQRAVDVDAEASITRLLDRRNDPPECAGLVDGVVVMSLEPVQVNGERQILAWLEQVHLLFKQKPVRAEINELLAADDALDNLIDFLV